MQTAFNVSYDMTLIRLKAMGILSVSYWKDEIEKIEKTTVMLLNAIKGMLIYVNPPKQKDTC